MLKEIVIGLSEFRVAQHDVCKGRALGKYAKTMFLSSDIRAKGILNLIHSDVCGPMLAVPLSGYHYLQPSKMTCPRRHGYTLEKQG